MRVRTKTPTGLIARFYGRLTHGPADGGTRLSVVMEGGRTALTALFYGGTVATNCREMTPCDTGGRFGMPIRPKNGVFYDENSAFNTLRGWYGYFQHSKANVFPAMDGFVRRRLRSRLEKRRGHTRQGLGQAQQRWPNEWFAKHGLLSLVAEHEYTRTIVKLRTH